MAVPAPASWSDWFLLAVAAFFLLWLAAAAARALDWAWRTPKRLEKVLREQGIRGRPYRLLQGDLRESMKMMYEERSKPMPLGHDIAPRVLPFLVDLMRDYGKISFTWFGPHPRVVLMDPELVKEVLSTKFGHFGKPKASPILEFLVAGLLSYDGQKWAQHRRIVNPAFHLEKLKCMLPAFSTCCNKLIERWENLTASEKLAAIDVWPELRNFTGDVISRTAFGSNYEEGRRIFQLQDEQAELLVKAIQSLFIPGYRFFPTRDNKRRKEIYTEVRTILRALIAKREKEMKNGTKSDNLLGYLLESNQNHLQENHNPKKLGMTINEVIDECKLFYFAGQETTSSLLTWTMVLLSMHPSWQELARAEVLQLFGRNEPDFDGLNRLKIVTMILYESLRLYPPALFFIRNTYKKMKLGRFTFPSGVQFLLPILLLHHDPEYWGEDANEFRPERFQEGIAKATKNQMIFFPFSTGPRICVGQNFALIESKLCLVKILQKFSFELSPTYIHAPYNVATLGPQHGAPIILHKI